MKPKWAKKYLSNIFIKQAYYIAITMKIITEVIAIRDLPRQLQKYTQGKD
jgi:hypothetical protein